MYVLKIAFQDFGNTNNNKAANNSADPGSSDTDMQLQPSALEVSSWPAQICMTGISFCFKVRNKL
jgi:hypothetical protein